jgi:hypothetical protein
MLHQGFIMKRPIILLPIRLVLRFGETGLKIILFLFGLAFKTSGFLVSRFFTLTVGALIGLLLGRKTIGVRFKKK